MEFLAGAISGFLCGAKWKLGFGFFWREFFVCVVRINLIWGIFLMVEKLFSRQFFTILFVYLGTRRQCFEFFYIFFQIYILTFWFLHTHVWLGPRKADSLILISPNRIFDKFQFDHRKWNFHIKPNRFRAYPELNNKNPPRKQQKIFHGPLAVT